MKRLILFICIFGAFSKVSIAQEDTDQQLAAYYYQNGEFDKAVMYYERLYAKAPITFYYEYYFKCLLELKQYGDAEKLVKRHMKRDERNLVLHLDLAQLYTLNGKEKQAEEEQERAIKQLQPNYSQIYQLAEAFSERGDHDKALATYARGSRLLNDEYRFAEHEGNLYARKGDYTKAFSKFLDLVHRVPSRLPTVQAYLVGLIDFEKEENPAAEQLRVEIIRRVQRDPNDPVMADMLIWYFQQRGDFQEAFQQVKAIDKRQNLRGEKLYDFAMMCLNNDQLDVATRSFEEITEMGERSPYYQSARKGLLNVLYQRIVVLGIYEQQDVQHLLAEYHSSLQSLGWNNQTVELIRQMTHVMAFHAQQADSASQLLIEALNMNGITQAQIAQLKMELADVLVLQGNIWDASLYYGQIEKSFKHDVLGHEAKFRNARIYYYSGDFDWSQAQLSVLKASTSKLIANDAMDLSLLITENLGLDSLYEPLQLFSRADFLYAQHLYDKAALTLDTLSKAYPFHGIADEALFLRYKIAKQQGFYDQAKDLLNELIEKFPKDLLADDAVYALGELYQFHYHDLNSASDQYKKILFEYPGSLYNVEARKRFRALRGETNFKE